MDEMSRGTDMKGWLGGMNQQTDVRAEIQGTGRKEAKMVSCVGGPHLWRKDSTFPFRHIELVGEALVSAL